MDVFQRLGLAAALAAGIVGSAAAKPVGGLLIHGGPIYTGVANAPRAEAVLVRGNRIAFVGSLRRARRLGAGARDVDLHGAAAYPGFVDAHCHLTGIGLRELTLNLEPVGSVEDLVQAVRAYAAAHPGDGPIIGRGWIETHWPEHRFPTRQDLDRAEPNRPVWLERSDGHASVGNSAAMRLGGVDATTVAPRGGQILKDAAGQPTGMLVDDAMDLVNRRLPAPSVALKTEALKLTSQIYAARGWTGCGSMSMSGEDLGIVDGLAARGEFRIRADNYLDEVDAGRVLASGPYADATGRIRVMGVKLYMDGSLGSRGAALLAPYSDFDGDGKIRMEHDPTLAIMRRALKSGAQVAIHAIGDRGNRTTLDWYQEAFADVAIKDRARAEPRWRIEHAQILNPADIPRFARLGVIASMQASHAIDDLYFAPSRLGDARLDGAYAWNSLLRSGAVVAAGTDAPVEKGDPLIEFYAAVYRHAPDGTAGPDWRLNEAVGRDQALRMLTWAPAYAALHERELGVLEAGKRADISAFSADLMTIPPAQILKAHAILTVVDGRIIYRAAPPPR